EGGLDRDSNRPGRRGDGPGSGGRGRATPGAAALVAKSSRFRMNQTASVGGRERLRLFCALRLPDDTVDELSLWQAEAFGRLDGVRVLGREQLHVTLAFLGSRPAAELDSIG